MKNGKAKKDSRIALTIAKLIDDVLQHDPNLLLTFICDNTDERAKKRLKLFKRWFQIHNENKVALLIEGDDLFYAGIILCSVWQKTQYL